MRRINTTNVVEANELDACPEKKLNDFLVITSRIKPSNSGLFQGRKRSKEYLKRLVIWSVKVIKAAKKSMIIPKPFQPTFF